MTTRATRSSTATSRRTPRASTDGAVARANRTPAQRAPTATSSGSATATEPSSRLDPAARGPAHDDWLFEVVFDYGEHEPDGTDPSRATGDLDVPARSVLLLPGRLRGPHVPAVPAGPDVPPLSRTNPTSAATASCARPTFGTAAAEARVGYTTRRAGRVVPRLDRVGGLPPRRRRRLHPPHRCRRSSSRTREAIVERHVATIDPASLENLPTGHRRRRLPAGRPRRRGRRRHPHRAGRRLVLQAEPQPGRRTRRAITDRPVRFGPLQQLVERPNVSTRAAARSCWTSPATGGLDLVDFDGPTPGFYERDEDGTAGTPFRPFASLPTVALGRPEPAVRRPRPATASPTC